MATSHEAYVDTSALIDSDVLIDFLQGIEAAVVEIDRYDASSLPRTSPAGR